MSKLGEKQQASKISDIAWIWSSTLRKRTSLWVDWLFNARQILFRHS